MRFKFEAESSHQIDELIFIMPPQLLHAVERPVKNTMSCYDGAAYDIIAIIDVPPTVSLDDLKGYMGKVWMGERMVRTVQPLEPKDEPEDTILLHPYYVF